MSDPYYSIHLLDAALSFVGGALFALCIGALFAFRQRHKPVGKPFERKGQWP